MDEPRSESTTAPPSESSTVAFDPDRTCDRCGQFGAYLFSGQALCESCYAGSGSCCPEFGQDDLWPKD